MDTLSIILAAIIAGLLIYSAVKKADIRKKDQEIEEIRKLLSPCSKCKQQEEEKQAIREAAIEFLDQGTIDEHLTHVANSIMEARGFTDENKKLVKLTEYITNDKLFKRLCQAARTLNFAVKESPWEYTFLAKRNEAK